MVVSHLMWVQGTELCLSQEELEVLLTAKLFFQPPTSFYFLFLR